SRGRYSTDASIYQIEPLGVVVPRSVEDIVAAVQIAEDFGVPVLPRGAGTSQCGQTVGAAVVVDTSKYLNRVLALDAAAATVTVEPGVVLDQLNAHLRPLGLHFPVDVSPSNRATIGGMTGNNSCGARSIRYGNMVHNVRAVDAVLSGGERLSFGAVPPDSDAVAGPLRYRELVKRMRALHQREAGEIRERFPKLLRRVGGYNIDSIDAGGHNMAHLLVGSEGTLGFSTAITLDLRPLPAHRVLAVCHFDQFRAAMTATGDIVGLAPSAVELVDITMIRLAREQPQFRATVDSFVRGDPAALLLVEFAGDDAARQHADLARLGQLLADLGHPGIVVEVTDGAAQRAIWEVRKAGLNILMAMKGEGKPVSFVEDCAVELADLPDYTERLNEIFVRHGTAGTWYAHASVGTLHVRPILNMKQAADVAKMRAIAEECFAMVRAYKGSHSGEHGDGIVRSEFHTAMFGERLVSAFAEVKDAFDPGGLFNPGKIVRPHRMDDRTLFRYAPDYRLEHPPPALDWSEWHGFAGAIEMCNNNGACRKADPGVMCPSYRVTRDEVHSTRGRANSLRLALSGQLAPQRDGDGDYSGDGGSGQLNDTFTSPEMAETMRLCVGCKGCKRECPTGVDMARMKIEFLYHYRARHGLPLRERLFAYLPRYAGIAGHIAALLNLRDTIPGLARASEAALGLAAARPLPRWRRDRFRAREAQPMNGAGPEVALFADTFNTNFAPEVPRAALRVLGRLGYRPIVPVAPDGPRPLCCGRTFLSAGLVDEARAEARRTLAVLEPLAARGIPILGLEPACLFTLKDEWAALLPGDADKIARVAAAAAMADSFLAAEADADHISLEGARLEGTALMHGHCHQKAFAAFGSALGLLNRIGGLNAAAIESSCCGMAGSFGYEAENAEISTAMAELSLLPAIREASPETHIVADGFSCRHQIAAHSTRHPSHAIELLDRALANPGQADGTPY
ncbi:MAG: FAD-binding and (Fe-S)-binding domain-containing protein, partial [Proteobacteria bacterium]|nr:FAD-binding and (Fe-S)-binding domain-containing protein [Pseudomonadota bacterium]